jgi:hypothetical protein
MYTCIYTEEGGRCLRCEDTSAVTINCLRVCQDDTQQVDGPSQRSRKLLRLPNRRNRHASLLSIPKVFTDIKQAGGTRNEWSSLSSSLSRFTVHPVPTPTCSLWFHRPPMPPFHPALGTECTLVDALQPRTIFRGGRVHIPIVIRSILPVRVGSGGSASEFTGAVPLVIFVHLLHPHSMYPYI